MSDVVVTEDSVVLALTEDVVQLTVSDDGGVTVVSDETNISVVALESNVIVQATQFIPSNFGVDSALRRTMGFERLGDGVSLDRYIEFEPPVDFHTVHVWDGPAKDLKLFTKVLTLDGDDQLTTVVTTDQYGDTFTTSLEWVGGVLISVTKQEG